MAKDLARTRQYITKFIEMKTHLNAVALKIQTIKSHQQLSESMKDVTKVLMKLNKQMDSKELEKIMQEFMRENEKAEMTQEMMGEAIDDAMDGESNAAEEDMIVNKGEFYMMNFYCCYILLYYVTIITATLNLTTLLHIPYKLLCIISILQPFNPTP